MPTSEVAVENNEQGRYYQEAELETTRISSNLTQVKQLKSSINQAYRNKREVYKYGGFLINAVPRMCVSDKPQGYLRVLNKTEQKYCYSYTFWEIWLMIETSFTE